MDRKGFFKKMGKSLVAGVAIITGVGKVAEAKEVEWLEPMVLDEKCLEEMCLAEKEISGISNVSEACADSVLVQRNKGVLNYVKVRGK